MLNSVKLSTSPNSWISPYDRNRSQKALIKHWWPKRKKMESDSQMRENRACLTFLITPNDMTGTETIMQILNVSARYRPKSNFPLHWIRMRLREEILILVLGKFRSSTNSVRTINDFLIIALPIDSKDTLNRVIYKKS